jgi:ABC-type phosphate transport system auxiliary subunit
MMVFSRSEKGSLSREKYYAVWSKSGNKPWMIAATGALELLVIITIGWVLTFQTTPTDN